MSPRKLALIALLTLCTFAAAQRGNNGVSSSSAGTTGAKLVASKDNLTQAANIGVNAAYAVPTTGFYMVACNDVVTQAATSSSTLPNCLVAWTGPESGANEGNCTTGQTDGTNTVGANNIGQHGTSGTCLFYAKTGTNINFLTNGYLSSGVTPMQYVNHVRVYYMGQ